MLAPGGRVAAPVVSAASPATVGYSKSSWNPTSIPKAPRRRRTAGRRAASCRPARRSCRARRHAPRAGSPSRGRRAPPPARSAAPRSARASSWRAPPGAGERPGSILPFGEVGSASSATKAEGTMKLGGWPCARARSAGRSACSSLTEAPSTARGTTYATSRLSPGASSRTTTATSRTPGAGARRRDLVELDPVAVDLHLIVDAAEELDLARGEVTREIASPGQARTGSRRTDP